MGLNEQTHRYMAPRQTDPGDGTRAQWLFAGTALRHTPVCRQHGAAACPLHCRQAKVRPMCADVLEMFESLRQHLPRFARLLMASALAIFVTEASACLFRTNIPDPDHPGRYSTIFIAGVAGVRAIPSIFSKSDLTPPHEVSLQGPIETLHGKPPTASSLRIGPGCGLPRPSVGEIGVFFVERWSGEVSPWYFDTRQHPRIDDIIERLNRSAAPKPAAELTPGNSTPRRSGTRPFR